MAKATSFIKLNRSILDWEWYKDKTVKELFIHLLLTASYEPSEFKGISVERGQCVTNLSTLSKELDLSIQQLRTAISKLKSTGEITSKNVGKNQVITIVCYDKYQGTPTRSATQNQQEINTESNRKSTTSKEIKKYKEINNIYNTHCACARTRGEHQNVILTDEEESLLITMLGKQRYNESVECLSRYIKRKPDYNSASHFEDLRGWVQERLNRLLPDKVDKAAKRQAHAKKAGLDIDLEEIFERGNAI